MDTSEPNKLPATPLGEWWKLIAMGTVLAGMVFLTFFYEYDPPRPVGSGPPVKQITVETPTLDLAQLELARDATRDERLVIEAQPLGHLLEKSIDVVPSVARALGMTDQPMPIEAMQANPASFRGKYVWCKGRLQYLSHGKSGHPIDGYKIHAGWIRTDDGHDVLFRVSIEPRDIAVGDYVRVEGFFMKLHDSHDAPDADRVPVIVGPELFRSFPPWEPVREIDPAMFADVDDELFADGAPLEDGGAWRPLTESQYAPLWHIASYAHTKTPQWSFDEWRKIRPFVSKEQLDAIKSGDVERGTPIRILGAFIQAHTWEARPNPLGIRFWTEAWVQIQDLGGKIIPVWIPDRIDAKRNQSLEIKAFYFRRMLYNTRDGVRFTPVFVADALHQFAPPPASAGVNLFKWAFVTVVMGVTFGLIWLGRRDRKRHHEHLVEMDRRRRRRREQQAAVVSE